LGEHRVFLKGQETCAKSYKEACFDE